MKRIATVTVLGILAATPWAARGDMSRIQRWEKFDGGLVRYDTNANLGMTIEAIGDPIPGGSWFMDFGVTTSNNFNQFGVGLTRPDGTNYWGLISDAAHPAIDFSAPGGTAGWVETYIGPFGSPGFVATAGGTAGTALNWRSHFADPQSTPFTLTAFAYNSGSEVFDKATATWSGSSWSYNAVEGMSWETFLGSIGGVPSAPAPGAALLAGIGLVSFGLVRRKFT